MNYGTTPPVPHALADGASVKSAAYSSATRVHSPPPSHARRPWWPKSLRLLRVVIAARSLGGSFFEDRPA